MTGEYTVTLAAADLPPTMPDSMRQQIVGTWTIAFHGGGHAVVAQNGREVVQAPYAISGDRFTLTADDTGPYACKSEGTYAWQMSSGRLTLTRVRDECEGRVVVVSTRPLVRRG